MSRNSLAPTRRSSALTDAYKHGFARGYIGMDMDPPRGWQR